MLTQRICKRHKDLDAITAATQRDSVSVAAPCGLFDATFGGPTKLNRRIGVSAFIVDKGSFGNVLRKIQSNVEGEPTANTISMINSFKISDHAEP